MTDVKWPICQHYWCELVPNPEVVKFLGIIGWILRTFPKLETQTYGISQNISSLQQLSNGQMWIQLINKQTNCCLWSFYGYQPRSWSSILISLLVLLATTIRATESQQYTSKILMFFAMCIIIAMSPSPSYNDHHLHCCVHYWERSKQQTTLALTLPIDHNKGPTDRLNTTTHDI